MESEVINVLLDHVMVCTVSHIPRSVRPLLAHVLSVELRRACSSTWCFVRLLMFAKAVLKIPVSHHRQCNVLSSILLVHTWSLSDGNSTVIHVR